MERKMSYFKNLFSVGFLLIATTVMSFGLKAEYRFEECNGDATVKNFRGNGLDGNLSGDAKVSIDSGKVKNSVSFLGNGIMSVEHNPNLDLVNNLTITFWVKPTKKQRQALISRGGGSGKNRKYGSHAEYSLVLWEDGKFKYKHNGTADTFSNSIIPLNKWTHIALTRDNDKKVIKIYINGVLDKTNTYSTAPSSSKSEKLIIGSGEFYSATMKNFQGQMDEIKIYNIVLPQDEIKSIYDKENNGEHFTGGCQLPPEAVNDSVDLPYEGRVNIDILSNDRTNDSDECRVDSSTVMIVSNFENATLSEDNKTLRVENEGVWSVIDNGTLSFISDSNFLGNPTPIEYIVSDNCGNISNRATVTLTRVNNGTNNITNVNNPNIIPQDDNSTTENNNTETFNINGRVWHDTNRNGLQDSGESGVANVTVVLYDSDGIGVVDRTITNSDGEYHLSNISSGSYILGFSNLPTGYIFTSQDVGDNDELDSDVDSSGRTDVFTIGNRQNNLIYDAGIISNTTTNNNGDNNSNSNNGNNNDNNSSSHIINNQGGATIIVPPPSENNITQNEINTTILNENNSSEQNGTINQDSEDCECEPYKSSISSLSDFGILFMFLLMSILALFIGGKELKYN
jgi:hypothetical protein